MQRQALLSVLAAGVLTAGVVATAGAQERTPETPRTKRAPLVGEEAPTFTLKSLDGKETFELEKARAKKPVILFFGSYT